MVDGIFFGAKISNKNLATKVEMTAVLDIEEENKIKD